MSTVLELENRTNFREELTFEKLENNSVLVTVMVDEISNPGWRDNELFSMMEYAMSKEQIVQVIEFLTTCLEK